MSGKKPTAAAVKRVILAYERDVYNPVKAWLEMLEDGRDATLLMALDDVHEELRVLYDDVRRGLVDWEEA